MRLAHYVERVIEKMGGEDGDVAAADIETRFVAGCVAPEVGRGLAVDNPPGRCEASVESKYDREGRPMDRRTEPRPDLARDLLGLTGSRGVSPSHG